MSNIFDFTDEELSVLTYVLWEQDNNLAMLPPGQFTEQATQVRVVAKLAHEFEQRNREAHALREAELMDRVADVIATVTSTSIGKSQIIARSVIREVRLHDSPPVPEAPQPSKETDPF